MVQHLGSEEADDDFEDSAIIQDLEQVVGIKIERQRSKFSESEGNEQGLQIHRKISVISQVIILHVDSKSLHHLILAIFVRKVKNEVLHVEDSVSRLRDPLQ